jgi:DNA-binding response OmpR family regulator
MKQSVRQGAFTPAAGVGKRVLLIEDSVYMRELLSSLLGAHGFAVTGAATGAEGMAAALKSRPDLVIVDLFLPDEDGLAVARTLLSEAGLADVPFMAISDFHTIMVRAEAGESGRAGYVMKHFDPERLVETARLLTGG